MDLAKLHLINVRIQRKNWTGETWLTSELADLLDNEASEDVALGIIDLNLRNTGTLYDAIPHEGAEQPPDYSTNSNNHALPQNAPLEVLERVKKILDRILRQRDPDYPPKKVDSQ